MLIGGSGLWSGPFGFLMLSCRRLCSNCKLNLQVAFGNEHFATPANLGSYALRLIRTALTIRKSLAATAHTSFPQGIFSFCFFKIHFVNCLDFNFPLVAMLITLPAPCTIKDLIVLSPRWVIFPFFSLCPVAMLLGTKP